MRRLTLILVAASLLLGTLSLSGCIIAPPHRGYDHRSYDRDGHHHDRRHDDRDHHWH